MFYWVGKGLISEGWGLLRSGFDDDGIAMVCLWALCSFQTQLRDECDPNQKSAASVSSQGGNEQTDAADSLASADRRGG